MNYAEATEHLDHDRNVSAAFPALFPVDEEIREMISQAKVVSFDVFDTLLVRPFALATDLFLLMERRTGVVGFHDARIKAESLARQRLARDLEVFEVTLGEIYKCLELPRGKKCRLNEQELMQLELETELSMLMRSPSVAALYDAAAQAGKIIIAVSDMYLPEALIKKALVRNGFQVARVFVSCEYRHSKHEGTLYKDVWETLDVAAHEILHFGDNYESDCAAALKAGVSGYHVPALREQLYRDSRYNQLAIMQLATASRVQVGHEKNLMASAMLGYLSLFKASQPAAPIAAIFGAMYAGPLVTGFAYWLNVMMRNDGVRHLRLFTRDGYVTKAIWDRLDLPGKASVLHSSRRLTLLPALVHNFEKEVASLLASSTTITMRECIHRLNLDDDSELLTAMGRLVQLDRPVNSPGRVEAALRALRDCEGVLRRLAQGELDGYKAYLATEAFDAETDALADCGWALSSQRRMERFLGCKLRGYYVGSLAHAHTHSGIKTFLFHQGDHAGWVGIAERAVELLELPFASLKSQICRFTIHDTVPVAVPMADEPQYETVRAAFIKRMHLETGTFADFLRPVLMQVTLEEFREVLLVLFSSLVNNPTNFEYHELAGLPHNREYGKSEFATIGTFWRLPGHGGYAAATTKSRWRDYLRVGWISLRQAGMRVTWMRVKRVIRRRLRGA